MITLSREIKISLLFTSLIIFKVLCILLGNANYLSIERVSCLSAKYYIVHVQCFCYFYVYVNVEFYVVISGRNCFTDYDHGLHTLVEYGYVIGTEHISCEKVVEYYTSFHRRESKKARLEGLSKNISEKRCELKANERVSERSERANGCIVGYVSNLGAIEI